MAYVPVNVVSKATKRIIRLWNRREREEVRRYYWFLASGFSPGMVYKQYLPNNTDTRTDMGNPWAVMCNGYVITTKTTESAADTFIRKLKDAINTKEGANTVKRMDDI